LSGITKFYGKPLRYLKDQAEKKNDESGIEQIVKHWQTNSSGNQEGVICYSLSVNSLNGNRPDFISRLS